MKYATTRSKMMVMRIGSHPIDLSCHSDLHFYGVHLRPLVDETNESDEMEYLGRWLNVNMRRKPR